MIICQFCRRNVLESQKTWDYHHVNMAALKVSAESGCVFCKRLAPFVKTVHGGIQKETKALYRWTMREVPHIRETKSNVSITFRPVPDEQGEKESTRDLPEVRFYVFHEEDLGYIPNEEALGPGTNSEASINLMKSWLNHCKNNHPRCKSHHTRHGFMPTRVLDVGVQGDHLPPTHIRVVETKKNHINEPYMTLSHCWGKKSFVQLTNDNFDDFTNRGIPWKNDALGNDICSNKNFEEAIIVTRNLGIRYIWIDSVCIIQNQPDKADWEAEAGLMHKVYRNSYCNLAATVSEDCSGGLFRERNLDVLPAQYVPDGASHRFRERNRRILSSDLWDKDLLGSHLYGRGWVFQERMLSPRLLQFAQGQIFWDCATTSACEALPAGLPPSLDVTAGMDRSWRQRLQSADRTVLSRIKSSKGSPEKFWESSVLAYTSCKLTKHDDKDAAMWGISKLVRDMQGEEYAYGLWATWLEEQLAWRVADRPAAKYPEIDGKEFPSWSWMCLDVPIQVAPRLEDNTRFYAVTNHEGGPIAFKFERMLHGEMDTGDPPNPHDTPEIKTNKPSDVEKEYAETWQSKTGPNVGIPKPDERSKLLSEEIEILGHICGGTLRYTSLEKRWFIDIDGVREQAVVEAYPDLQPGEGDAICQFLVLAASRIFRDRHGQEFYDLDQIEQSKAEVEEMQYSGVGILVQWENKKEKRLRRVGAVTFRQLNWDDWASFRRACGEDQEALQYELDVEDGQSVWLA
ncbi:heterokaryon incompatibility protein [Colletotrichum truncatum]|uniref:Heterokaryon incompatibility protein n=1 Tax=Colletotrichum truncatum TaxID=5467 RepID=A0ACC3YRN1_COLTU|nr:heterokaryon incompatibility protein [Colletotrichum truncatum]KAF6799210.1 heterokaryon incompatibility protein [Colletotrichum truncatum]